MAFDRTKLALLATGGGIEIFGYVTTDPKATVIAANYFGPAARDLGVGDRINLSCNGVHTDAVVATSNPATNAVTVLTQADYA